MGKLKGEAAPTVLHSQEELDDEFPRPVSASALRYPVQEPKHPFACDAFDDIPTETQTDISGDSLAHLMYGVSLCVSASYTP